MWFLCERGLQPNELSFVLTIVSQLVLPTKNLFKPIFRSLLCICCSSFWRRWCKTISGVTQKHLNPLLLNEGGSIILFLTICSFTGGGSHCAFNHLLFWRRFHHSHDTLSILETMSSLFLDYVCRGVLKFLFD